MKFLVTAGRTREALDPVRFISNRSSGKMGYAVASAALKAGHTVTLVSGPVALEPPQGVKLVSVLWHELFFKMAPARRMARAVRIRTCRDAYRYLLLCVCSPIINVYT